MVWQNVVKLRLPIAGQSLLRRALSSSTSRFHAKKTGLNDPGALRMTFVSSGGEEIQVGCKPGESLMDIAMANDIDLECACEGSLACSTCHVIVDPKYYDKLEEPTDDENDMLDLAFGLTETSRLGCQIIMNRELDKLKVQIPSNTRNVQTFKLEST